MLDFDGIARHEGLLLLELITGKSRTEWIARPIALSNEKILLPDAQRRAFFDAVARRRNGEPLQYIMGEWEFYGLRFKVDKRVLIPRSETEILVEAVVNRCKKIRQQPLRILDVCTGSACIAVTLAKVLHDAGIDAHIVATDISADALAVAKENAALHGVTERVRFEQMDLAEGFSAKEEFHIAVSNPPYIPADEIPGLQIEVRDHEPHLALDGGADGMDLYRRLLPQVFTLLKPGGLLFLEIGPTEVGALAAAAGFAQVQVLPDYAGLARIVTAVRP